MKKRLEKSLKFAEELAERAKVSYIVKQKETKNVVKKKAPISVEFKMEAVSRNGNVALNFN